MRSSPGFRKRFLPIASRGTGVRAAACGALLLCATLVAYLPAVHGGFLWDDNAHVTRPDLRTWDGLRRIWFELGATQQYYPLLHTAFWVEHRLWGDATLGYHLTNVFLHAAAACLVVAIMRRLALPGAWLGGCIFALHPICVESVAWISEQKNTLSAVFCLGSAFVYLGFDRDRRPLRYGWALALFVLALLTKTVTAPLPAALLVLFWWQRGRLEWRRDVRPLLPWLALGLAAGLFTAWVERTFVIGGGGARLTLGGLGRILLAGRVIWFYAGKLIWPANLIFIYPRWNVDPAAAWQYLFPLGVFGLLAGSALLAGRNRGPLAGFLIFAGMLFPALGFFDVYPFIYSYVADHFQYLASLGLIVPLAAGLALAARRLPPGLGSPALAPLGAGLLLATLGCLTWRQCREYRDAQVLYRATLARNPESWMAHNNLGGVLINLPGRLPEAASEYAEALRLNPNLAEAHNNLGFAWLQMPGRLPDAIAQFQEALRLEPDFAGAHDNLGLAWAQVPGRLPDAIAQCREAVRLKPDLAKAHNDLGVLLAKVPGRLPEAIAQFQEALRLEPDLAETHNNLGDAWARLPDHVDQAISEINEALRLQPDLMEGHNNLGIVLVQAGRLPEAVAQFQEVVRLRPDYAVGWHQLGIVSFHSGDLPAAAAAFRQELRLSPNDPTARKALAAVLQAQGR